jgi:Ala-tRNA(Pro) deacylase
MISTKVKAYLDSAGVPYTRHAHRPVYTSQEVAQSVHVPGREMVKSVVLKADEALLVLAVLSSNNTVNLDVLRGEMGCSVLRLASEPEFRDAFPTCESGAVPLFGSLFGIPTYCDAGLSQNREIEFIAGTYDETIRMKFDDYQRLENPRMANFAHPYQEGVQRLAA